MKFEYTGRHLEVTPALRSHVEDHFDKIRHLFDGDGTKAHVVIEVEKGRHRAEIILHWRDHVLTATSTVSDMYQALSQTIDKIEKQALKLKSKVIDKHQKKKKTAVAAAPIDDVRVEDNSSPRILDVEKYPVKPMTAEEAALRIQSQEDQFVVFRDAENEKISVIYKRKDGHYGLIQP
ncbi:MAG: ribosome hibernation-promoting factor, HPF/YfiA family [Pyrinomonadaceae bacterium]